MDPHRLASARERTIQFLASMGNSQMRGDLEAKGNPKLLRIPYPRSWSATEWRVPSKCKSDSVRTPLRTRYFWTSSRKIPNGLRKRYSNYMNALDSNKVRSTSGTGICSVRQAKETRAKTRVVTMTTQEIKATLLLSTRVALICSLMPPMSQVTRASKMTVTWKTCRNATKSRKKIEMAYLVWLSKHPSLNA